MQGAEARAPVVILTYPLRIANWVAIAWVVLGLLVTAYIARNRRDALLNAERIFVEDEPAPAPA